MKRGTEYAKRIKRLYHDLVSKFGKPAPTELTDPIEQLLVGILSFDTTEHKAQTIYRKLREQMVDLNELRVTPATELAHEIGDAVPHAVDKARRIVDALNGIRRRQDALDLSFLKQRGRKEAREYLESLEGMTPYVASHVMLFSLGGHAIPLDNLTLHVLHKEDYVEAGATPAEVQGFLERNVPALEAQSFCSLLNRFVATHGGRVSMEKLEQMLNPPAPPVARKDKAAAAEARPAAVEPPRAEAKKKPEPTKAEPTKVKPTPRKKAAPAKAPEPAKAPPARKAPAPVPAASKAHKPPPPVRKKK